MMKKNKLNLNLELLVLLLLRRRLLKRKLVPKKPKKKKNRWGRKSKTNQPETPTANSTTKTPSPKKGTHTSRNGEPDTSWAMEEEITENDSSPVVPQAKTEESPSTGGGGGVNKEWWK
mmetsp:Transcript_28885/g.40508  ORF Transcript_28885/g.40508 Transcript_28885/m.40508 type:complete len:118 (-) Transcript_28885:243-596(-)